MSGDDLVMVLLALLATAVLAGGFVWLVTRSEPLPGDWWGETEDGNEEDDDDGR